MFFFHALFVVVKKKAGLLQMIILRDRMMGLGIHEKLTVRWGGVNAYGQPDRKMSIFCRLP